MKRLILLLTALTALAISCQKKQSQTKKAEGAFEVFLEEFSQDSLFQISRVNFPLRVVELNDDYDPVQKTIGIKEYRKMDLRYDDSVKNRDYDKYTQKVQLSGNKATVEMRGIDNGIMMDVYFEKREGKWMLVGWEDSST